MGAQGCQPTFPIKPQKADPETKLARCHFSVCLGGAGQSNREDGSGSICQFFIDSQILVDEMPLQSRCYQLFPGGYLGGQIHDSALGNFTGGGGSHILQVHVGWSSPGAYLGI